MSHVITVGNTTQSNLQPVEVQSVPSANPEDLIWSVGGGADTTQGTAGTIFPNVLSDQVNPAYWYHGGNPLITTDEVKVHSNESLTAVNNTLNVVSDEIQKGLFELRTTTPNDIDLINEAVGAQIDTVNPHNFSVGDFVEIKGSGLTIIAPGIYKVTSIVSATQFTINNTTFTVSGTFNSSTVTLFNYYWDEVYTTPLGLYNAQLDADGPPAYYSFTLASDNSDVMNVFIDDPNIIPKQGDSIIIQRFFSSENSFTNESTTDGYNNVKNYSQTETYEFKILTVVADTSNPLSLVNPYIEYTLTLDKSFAPIIEEYYMLVLLNRKGTTPDRELFTDTWKLTQVYREQLLGDPYTFVGVTQPAGRTNYLYYKGAELLGIKNLLRGIMPTATTPFIVLDFADEIKDRIYDGNKEFEVHLPCILLQGETTPIILTNPNPTLLDYEGVGTYSGLYLKYTSNTSPIRYGWVFYDLRIVVIDHPELATVMGYNSNRNFTLPTPQLTTNGNTKQKPTPSTPILITNVSYPGTITITTIGNHNLVLGDLVHIEGVLGTIEANSPSVDSYFYAKPITTITDPTGVRTFEIYLDSLMTIPVVGSAVYTGGGLIYGHRLPYEYFFTYRLIGGHYKTLPYAEVIPFNWQEGGLPSDSTSATLDVRFDFLTHLVDIDTARLEGFNATGFEIIIGKYTQSLADPYISTGVEDVVVLTAVDLIDSMTNLQYTNHTTTITRSTYDTAVTDASLPLNDLGNTSYDLLNVDVNKIYNLTANPLPETLFTSEGEWTVGLIKYKAQATQYNLTFTVNVPASKWNGTQNPSFEPGNNLMNEKLITELEFLVTDDNGNVVDSPYIYAKISPPIKKNNINDLSFSVGLDF